VIGTGSGEARSAADLGGEATVGRNSSALTERGDPRTATIIGLRARAGSVGRVAIGVAPNGCYVARKRGD